MTSSTRDNCVDQSGMIRSHVAGASIIVPSTGIVQACSIMDIVLNGGKGGGLESCSTTRVGLYTSLRAAELDINTSQQGTPHRKYSFTRLAAQPPSICVPSRNSNGM